MLEENSQTIALFGGSFDPPHIGHEAIVKALLELKYIDKIVIMPTFLNPLKKFSHAPSQLRLKWLKEIFSSFDDVIVSDFEMKQNRKTFTIESVEYLLESYQTIYLVIGADNLSTLNKWHKYGVLQNRVIFIVAHRDKIDIPDTFIDLKIDNNISSSLLRKSMNKTKLPQKCAQEIAQYYKEKNEK